MPSRVTVLGSCGAWPEPGLACAGFLLEYDGFRLILDLGYGTLPRLLTELGSATGDGVDAVLVSHHHPDHMVDLHGLLRARYFGRREAAAIPLFAPAGVVSHLVELEDGDRTAVRKVFDWHPIPAPPQEIGPFRVDSVPVPHHVPSAGVRLSATHLTVAYTGDTGPAPALTDLAQGCDLLIADATFRADEADGGRTDGDRADDGRTDGGPTVTAGEQVPVPADVRDDRLNLTAHEAGQLAAATDVSRLLLTHFWPGTDREASRKEAAAVFSGQIFIAAEGASVPLG